MANLDKADLAHRLILVSARLARDIRLSDEGTRLTSSQALLLAAVVRKGGTSPTSLAATAA